MITLDEIAYDLLTIVRPHVSDDSDISLRQIKFWIKNQRALWIKQDVSKRRSIDPEVLQTICVDLELVDPSDCCDIEIGCGKILRSTKEMPSTVELSMKDAILRVGSVDKMAKPFSYIDYLRVPYVGSGKFNSNQTYSFMHDKYLYVFSPGNMKFSLLRNASVRGIFENPEEAAKFKDCNTGDPCYTDQSRYPIKAWMLPAMKETILKSNLLIQANAEVISDDSNNATSDLKQAGQAKQQ